MSEFSKSSRGGYPFHEGRASATAEMTRVYLKKG